MRLVRFGSRGSEKPGLVDVDGAVRDLSAHIAELSGTGLDPDRLAELAQIDPASLPLVEKPVRLCAPVRPIGKIIGIGPNYHESARQGGFRISPEPTLFMKAPSAVNGPNDPIEIPRLSTRTDWGVELAVEVEKALDHVAGYTLANDVTERHFQLQRGGQWFKGKSHDTFAPLGPWLVTKDEGLNPDEIDLWLDVNGERQQSGSTNRMIFKIPYIVSYISRFLRLEAGDVILTGTPAGVGLASDPPRFLSPGDRVTLGGTGLGEQDAVCIAS